MCQKCVTASLPVALLLLVNCITIVCMTSRVWAIAIKNKKYFMFYAMASGVIVYTLSKKFMMKEFFHFRNNSEQKVDSCFLNDGSWWHPTYKKMLTSIYINVDDTFQRKHIFKVTIQSRLSHIHMGSAPRKSEAIRASHIGGTLCDFRG